MKLRIADNLVLGADLVVSTAGIFATKGLGKSHLAQVTAEEMLAHGQVIVAIDPTDAWYGLRSSADGKHDGYPVVVIGGDHGDLKLEPGGAVQLAEAVVAERFSCVICTDGMSDMAETRFVREFLDTIYRKNRKPLHIFVDEADVFAPQKPFDVEDARCIRAMSHIVRRGRKKGIGTTLITQRPAELNASVRTMVDMLFVLGMSHNLDIDAVEKWLRLKKKKQGNNAAYLLQEEMIESLDALQRGDAWVWAPRMKIHKRFRARAKRTFDSGATPKPGQTIKAPKKLAPVDLQRLGQAMAAAVQRQKENDPSELRKQLAAARKELERVGKGQDRAEANEKELHADSYEQRVRIAELEKQLSAAKKEKAEAIKPADLRRLEALVKKIDKLVLRITGTNADLELHLSGLRAEATKLADVASRVTQARGKKAGGLVREVLDLVTDASMTQIEKSWSKGDPLHHAYLSHPPKSTKPAKPTKSPIAAKPVKPVKPVPPSKARPTTVSEDLQPAHLRLLSAIAWWESIGNPSPDLGGVAFIANTSSASSAFNHNRSRLRAAGYIEYPSNGQVRLTDAGRALAPPPTLPATNEALHQAVLEKVTPAVGRLLRVLIQAYPNEMPLSDLAELANTSQTSSAFNNNRSWLRARGLAEYPHNGVIRATALLFPEDA
jgi:hypothetical protein